MGSSGGPGGINKRAGVATAVFGAAAVLLLMGSFATGAPWQEGSYWTPTGRAMFFRGYLAAGTLVCLGAAIISFSLCFGVGESDKGLVWKLMRLALLGVACILFGLVLAMRLTWVLTVGDQG